MKCVASFVSRNVVKSDKHDFKDALNRFTCNDVGFQAADLVFVGGNLVLA